MLKLKRLLFLMLLVCCLATPLAHAKQSASSFVAKRNAIVKETLDNLEAKRVSYELSRVDQRADWNLSLMQCTQLVLLQNTNVKFSYLDLDTTQRTIIKEDAVFDTAFSSTTGASSTRTSPALDTLVTSVGETLTLGAAVTKKIQTGGTIGLSLDHDRSGQKHVYATEAKASLTHPILKGFGPDVTLAPLRISRNNYAIAIEDLRTTLNTEISSAQTTYWNILKSQEILKARKLAYEQAKDLIKQNKKALALGSRTQADVLQAQATAASRDEDVLQAENDVEEQEDILKRLLNVTMEQWNSSVLLADKIDPDFQPLIPDTQWCFKKAFANRPDYKKELERLENEKINLILEKDDLLPTLDLATDYKLNGAGESGRNSFNRFETLDYHAWSATLTLSFPWGFRSDTAELAQQVNALRRQELKVEDTKFQIIREVRDAIRDVTTNIKRVHAAQLAYELQTQKLQAEQKKFDLGISTSFEVLEFQEDLVDASVTKITAVADYHQSIIQLWKTLGITLQQNGIVFEGDAGEKA